MFFSISSGWELFWLDVFIYIVQQIARVFIDYLLPKSWSDSSRWWFQCFAWEDGGKFYEKYFKVSYWKDFLPVVNGLNEVDKSHLQSLEPEYLESFIHDINLGESNHVRSIIMTGIFIIWNPPGMFFLIFTLSFLGHLPFIIIQRYNRPRMQRLLRINRKRQEQREKVALAKAAPNQSSESLESPESPAQTSESSL